MTANTASVNSPKTGKEQVRKLTLAAMLTAVVVVLALLGTAIKFGTFNVNLALVPIVIGAALLGVGYGAWFGLVNAAVVCAALVCPLVNTGVFLIGCRLFFWDTIAQWAEGSGTGSTFAFAIVGLVGLNFVLEVAINVILAPVIARILGFSQDKAVSLMVYGLVLALVGLAVGIFALVLIQRVKAGENPGGVENPMTRYLVMCIVSAVVAASGAALAVLGSKRKH